MQRMNFPKGINDGNIIIIIIIIITSENIYHISTID